MHYTFLCYHKFRAHYFDAASSGKFRECISYTFDARIWQCLESVVDAASSRHLENVLHI